MNSKIDSLENLVKLIPVFKAGVPADLSVAVCDLGQFTAYFPGDDINLHIKAGQKINPEEPLAVAMRQNKRLQAQVPADFYGFEFTGTALPLTNKENKVIGGMAVQVRRQSELRAIVGQVSQSLSQANDQMTAIAASSTSLAQLSQELLEQSGQAGESVKETDQVLSMIKKIAGQTHLLGLNAAIEAARAGEKGKGFEIVANEIRKFSKETVESTQKVSDITSQIQHATIQMGTSIEKIAEVGNKQADSMQQISAFVEEIQELSKKLNEFANKL